MSVWVCLRETYSCASSERSNHSCWGPSIGFEVPSPWVSCRVYSPTEKHFPSWEFIRSFINPTKIYRTTCSIPSVALDTRETRMKSMPLYSRGSQPSLELNRVKRSIINHFPVGNSGDQKSPGWTEMNSHPVYRQLTLKVNWGVWAGSGSALSLPVWGPVQSLLHRTPPLEGLRLFC